MKKTSKTRNVIAGTMLGLVGIGSYFVNKAEIQPIRQPVAMYGTLEGITSKGQTPSVNGQAPEGTFIYAPNGPYLVLVGESQKPMYRAPKLTPQERETIDRIAAEREAILNDY